VSEALGAPDVEPLVALLHPRMAGARRGSACALSSGGCSGGRRDRRVRYAAVGLLIVFAVAACAGSKRGESAPEPITREVLAAMVPTTRDFPREVRDVAPIDNYVERGYVTNAKAAAKTPDPADSGADLSRAGRTGGYHHLVGTYTSVSTFASAEVSVDAFGSDEEAQRFINKQFSDLQPQVGKEDAKGHGKISFVERPFVPAGLGPASGVRYTFVFGDGEMLHYAVEGFRLGRVAGWSTVARIDEVDPRLLADELAQTLRRQLQRVLATGDSN
jgi:hypothetical protein